MHHLIDEENLLLVFIHLDDLADVGMVKLLEELDFFEELATLTKFEVLLTDHLDGASDARNLVDTATDATKSTLADDFMQVEVVLDVILVRQVELFGVELDAMRLIRVVVGTILEHVLEVLPAESDHLFWVLAHHFLDKVFEDAGEGIGHIDLLGCENSHLADV